MEGVRGEARGPPQVENILATYSYLRPLPYFFLLFMLSSSRITNEATALKPRTIAFSRAGPRLYLWRSGWNTALGPSRLE